jgi:N-methylhydantoinase B
VSGATTETGGRVRELVIGALSQAVPERGIAGWSHNYLAVYLSGTDPRTDKKFIHIPLDGLALGGGARAHADGYMASNPASSNMLIPNMEILEQHCPIRYLKREVPIDAGGDGKFRGGGGLEVEWEILSPMTLTLMSSRREYPPPGIFGGGDGGPSGAWIWRAKEKKEITLPQKITGVSLSKGDRLRIRTAGGGGYGNPQERNPEMVRKDLRLGFVSPEKAKRIYGFERKAF